MKSLNFIYQHPLFKKTIQLYGDRAGGQGNFEFAGLAELNETKIVLVYGNEKSLEQPADWRRFLRLINLGEHLKKPIVLWNINTINAATTQHQTSLAIATAIQNTKMQLLKLQQPIIAVFDEEYEWGETIGELGWADAYVLVKQDKVAFPTQRIINQLNLINVSEQVDISKKIVKLLNEVSKNSSEELVKERLQQVCPSKAN